MTFGPFFAFSSSPLALMQVISKTTNSPRVTKYFRVSILRITALIPCQTEIKVRFMSKFRLILESGDHLAVYCHDTNAFDKDNYDS